MFADAAGDRLTPRAFYRVWGEACRRAGCPGKIPTRLPPNRGKDLVRAGVPEKTAMQLTGHKTRSVFDRYDIVNEADCARPSSGSRRCRNLPDGGRSEPLGITVAITIEGGLRRYRAA